MGATAGHITGVHAAVVVAVERVVGTRGRAVSHATFTEASVGTHTAFTETTLAETTLMVRTFTAMFSNTVVVTVASVLMTHSLALETLGCGHATSTADVLGDTLERIVTLLTAGKGATLGGELLHGHGGQGSSVVVGGLVVVNLVDGNGGVDNIGLDGLLLDNRLDSLVDVLDDVSVDKHEVVGVVGLT